jgi:hypothetical protein
MMIWRRITGCSSFESHGFGADRGHYHPGQGLAVALVSPLRIAAHDARQHLIEAKCVLHGFLLGKRPGVEDLPDRESRRVGEHASRTKSLIDS